MEKSNFLNEEGKNEKDFTHCIIDFLFMLLCRTEKSFI
jgi:hypothetical protein